MMKEVLLTLFSVVSSTFFLLFSVTIGWLIVWKLFLSRFKFVRELLGGMNDSNPVDEHKQDKTRTKKLRRD